MSHSGYINIQMLHENMKNCVFLLGGKDWQHSLTHEK